MAIDKDIEANILRYHFVEQWRVGTIATQLGIHHSVMCQHFSGHKFTQLYAEFRSLRVINSHW